LGTRSSRSRRLPLPTKPNLYVSFYFTCFGCRRSNNLMKVAQRKSVSFFDVLSDPAVHAPPVETAAKSGLYNLSIFIDHVNQTSSGRFSTSRYAVTSSAECIRPDLRQDANASATVASSGAGATVTACAAPVADSPPVAPASGQIPFLSSYPCPSYFRQLPQPPRIPPRSQTASSPLQNVHTLLSSSLPVSAPGLTIFVFVFPATAAPEQTAAPTQVNTDPAAAPAHDVAPPSDAGSPAPGSAVLVSPAGA
jgi:hypothetical protein